MEPLKTSFDRALVASVVADLGRAGLRVDGLADEAADGLDALELTARARHVADVVARRLPDEPEAALALLVRSFGPVHATDELLGAGMGTFRYLPHSVLIGDLGVRAPAAGLRACRELTRRFTAEFCVRPIFEAHPGLTWDAVDRWVVDPDPHVRRLVSEGLRPRLPWAGRLRTLQADPTPALARLHLLVDDPATLVRRSVANHLGDIAKDHPDLAVAVAARWLGERADREPLVRHGLRHLVRQGHAGALAALGHSAASVELRGFTCPAEVAFPATVAFAFEVVSTTTDAQDLVVDAVVTFPRPGRAPSRKVFKVARIHLEGGGSCALSGKVRLAPMTTRAHHPGPHTVDVQVNGLRLGGGGFLLTM